MSGDILDRLYNLRQSRWDNLADHQADAKWTRDAIDDARDEIKLLRGQVRRLETRVQKLSA